MQDAAAVGVLHRIGERRHQRRRDTPRHGLFFLLQPGGQGHARAIRGSQVGNVADGAGLVNGHQVRVVQPGRGQRFVMEALAQFVGQQRGHAGSSSATSRPNSGSCAR